MSERRQFRDLAEPETLHEVISSFDLRGGSETVELSAAGGRVLEDRLVAGIDVPGFDRAAMDGYAVRAPDTFGASRGDPVTLEVVGRVDAGERPGVAVGAGEAIEIATGAVVPEGATAVVIVEVTAEADGGVEVRESVTPGENVMAAGDDVAAGDRALGPGSLLTQREIALLAALGRTEVTVRGRPSVGIISTGAELVGPEADLDPTSGHIYDVNGHALEAAVRAAGGDPQRYATVPDDEAEMASILSDAARHSDLLLTTGSTSASASDVVYRVIEDRGELLLHGVAVKPGKPTLAGRFESRPFVGLPGYPVSALSVFRTFVAPALARAAGRPQRPTALHSAMMATLERFEEGRHRLLPVGLVDDGAGETIAYPVDKGSGATTSLVEADGVVEIDADTAYVSRGEEVSVQLFSADVLPPRVLVVGERDAVLADLLDRVDSPRFLGRGSPQAGRSLRDGIVDVGVVAGPIEVDATAEQVAVWYREWGLIVPSGNPETITGVGDLVDRDLSFANRDSGAGLRASLESTVETLAGNRGRPVSEVVGAIEGFGLETRGLESPARRVGSGRADAGLGLRATASRRTLGFVPVGTERVRILVSPTRRHKPGVEELVDALADLPDLLDDHEGFSDTPR